MGVSEGCGESESVGARVADIVIDGMGDGMVKVRVRVSVTV